MIDQIAFWVVALCLLISALRAVTSRDLVHSVLWMGVTLTLTAVVFLLLSSPFLAGVQILLYAGGVITLMLFGIMLTRKHTDLEVRNPSDNHVRGLIPAATLFAALCWAILHTPLPNNPATEVVSSAVIGASFLTDHLLAFEVLSLLLLAVMIGAIVLGRKRDAGAAPPASLRRLGAKP